MAKLSYDWSGSRAPGSHTAFPLLFGNTFGNGYGNSIGCHKYPMLLPITQCAPNKFPCLLASICL